MGDAQRFIRDPLVLVALALALTACRDGPTSVNSAQLLEMVSALPTSATVGSTLSPAFIVRDANGQELSGLPVRIEVTEGQGELRDPARRTTTGPTSAGEWTIGTAAGANALSITVGSLPAVILRVDGIPESPSAITALAGADQIALAGDVVPQTLAFRVHDRFGNGIPGITIALQVRSGGGDVSPSSSISDAQGIVSGFVWRLGRSGGGQTIAASVGSPGAGSGNQIELTISASVRSEYTTDVRFFGPEPSEAIQAVFRQATARIQAVIVSDLPDVPLFNFDAGRCGVHGITLNETIDDVIIFAQVSTIDGPGRILGSAGPCITRSQSRFAVIGVMRFDVEDLNAMLSDGRLLPVVLHEMLHVVGVGTLWRTRDLISASGTSDPRFGGPLATARCVMAGGMTPCGTGTVPLENLGSSGTAEAHWRESTFDSELMTGFAEPSGIMPLSAITLASLEDLGLSVNYFAGDPYVLPGPAASITPRLGTRGSEPWEVLEFPRFDVTPAGWVRPVTWK